MQSSAHYARHVTPRTYGHRPDDAMLVFVRICSHYS
jgi:hypothetical protein